MVSHLILAFVKSVGTASISAIERNIIPHGFTKEEVHSGIRCLYLLDLIHVVDIANLDGRPQYIFSWLFWFCNYFLDLFYFVLRINIH